MRACRNGLPVNWSHDQLVTRSSCRIVNSSQSTRHMVKSSHCISQLVTKSQATRHKLTHTSKLTIDQRSRPASVAEWLAHSAAMCSKVWRAQWPGFDSARARPPTKELFLIIPTHMMNTEIIPGRKKDGSTVSSINCDRCRQLDLAVSSLLAAPAWVEANRLGWPLVGVIHSASQG